MRFAEQPTGSLRRRKDFHYGARLILGALVFEGYRAYWNEEKQDLFIFRLEEHMRRLEFSMDLLELDNPPSIETFTNDILATLKANAFREDTYIRLQVYVDDWGSMFSNRTGRQFGLFAGHDRG